jgi:fucose 4-O-acetylase-like acetyltransferase
MAKSRTSSRLEYVDELRVGLTALVILHHVGQAYGPTGGIWPIHNAERARVLGAFFSSNAAFFMGLFFFLAGYFEPGAYERKGAAGFLRDRFRRLGWPLFVTSAFIMPFIAKGLKFPDLTWGEFFTREYWHFFFSGHMWFVGQLLVYAVVYAVWRRWRPVANGSVPKPPGHRELVLYMLALAAASFAVRIFYPVDFWFEIPFFRFEPAHVLQYVSLFWLGHVAHRGAWLDRLDAKVGMTWFRIGLGAIAFRYAINLAGLPIPLAGGGLKWATLNWALLEAVICTGMCVGLLTWLRERGDRGAAVAAWAPDTYATYTIHIYLVLALQAPFANVALPPLAKFAIVGLLAVPVCFLAGRGLRRLPGLRTVF